MIDASTVSWETIVNLVPALLGGCLLGLFFYGGLWWTVRRLPHTRRPAALTISSFVVRTAVTVLGFYLIMDGRLDRILVAMAGFLVIRTLLLHRWGPNPVAVDAVKGNLHADQS